MRRSDRGSRPMAALGNGILSVALSCLLAPAVWADSLPASIRACAQEPDSLKRLMCFDREVARYKDQPAAASPVPSPAPQAAATSATGAAEAASTAIAPPGQAQATSASPARHITARIVSIESFPDAIVVHLDNGQVWQQIQEATASVSLRPGDTVSIDREMAAYWLSGKDGTAVKVRQKIQK